MANPVNDRIKDWKADAGGGDTNNPTSSTAMGSGQVGDLSGELRVVKSELKSTVENLSWERWLGEASSISGNIAFTYISGTSFSVNDNFGATGRNVALVGRRIRAAVTAGTVYGVITGVSFSSPNTTITVTLDSGALDSGLSEVSFGPEPRATTGVVFLTNKTGGSLAVGDVVALDSANDTAVALADTASTQKQLVVSLDAPANNAIGRFAVLGVVAILNVTGSVTRGNYLVKSATTKVAADSGTAMGNTTAIPTGAFAVALTASGGGGSVVARLLGVTVSASSPTTDVQVFTSNGTWTKPANAKEVFVYLVGGGAGGGSGRRSSTGVPSGGGGGAGGAISTYAFQASLLGSTETVTIGAGGNGGAAQTTNDTDGNVGTAGGATTFGSWLRAGGGTAGGAGINGSVGTALAGTGFFAGGNGGGASSGVGTAGGSGIGGGGGGGGGGLSGGSAVNGGAGGAGGNTVLPTSNAGGSAGTASGGSGGNGTAATANLANGGGGGGGGASAAAATGGSGGNGALYGGGGGGGAASANGNSSGAGGTGAAGIAVVITIF